MAAHFLELRSVGWIVDHRANLLQVALEGQMETMEGPEKAVD